MQTFKVKGTVIIEGCSKKYGSSVIELSKTNWDAIVNETTVPLVVEFWAPWCPYCRQLTPIFEKVSLDYGEKAKFAKLNIDEEPKIAARFGVLTIPLLKVFCSQRSIAERAGLMPEAELKKFVDQVVTEAPSCIANSSILVDAKLSGPGKEQNVLLDSKVIAIVGLSKDANKDSYSVAAYLKSRGYRLIPVNPTASEILGEKAYPSLLDIPDDLSKTIDIVDIFRPSDQVPPIVDQAIQLKQKFGTNPRMVWMQLGIRNPEAAERARAAGLAVTQNMCVAVEHRRIARPDS